MMSFLVLVVGTRTVLADEAPSKFALHDASRAVQEVTFVDREVRGLRFIDFSSKMLPAFARFVANGRTPRSGGYTCCGVRLPQDWR